MRYVADKYKGASAALSLDADAVSKYTDIVDLSIGDTDFITDERIINKAFADAKAGYTRYGFPKGDPELIKAIAKAWQEDFGQEIPESEIIMTASSCLGMQIALMAILNPGDEVIVLAPYFGVYKQQIEVAGGVCVEIASAEEENWSLKRDALEKAVTNKTRAIIFNNPTNPTGGAYSMEDMRVLAEFAQKHEILLLADEIYTRYLFEGEFIPMRTLPGMEQYTVTLNSFSKNFMMTGWRVGYIIAPRELVSTIGMLSGGMNYTVPSISQRAAIKALELRNDIQEKYITQYKRRVLYAVERIERIPYFTLSRPKGTFYLFPGIAKTGLTAPQFCKKALEEAHVLLTPGDAFGEAGKGHIRIACTTSDENMKEAFDRLEKLSF